METEVSAEQMLGALGLELEVHDARQDRFSHVHGSQPRAKHVYARASVCKRSPLVVETDLFWSKRSCVRAARWKIQLGPMESA